MIIIVITILIIMKIIFSICKVPFARIERIKSHCLVLLRCQENRFASCICERPIVRAPNQPA